MNRIRDVLSARPVAYLALVGLGLALMGAQGGFAPGSTLWLLGLGLAFALGFAAAKASVRTGREPVRSDPSTGLANAHALFDLVAAEVDRAHRYDRVFTLAYVGVENLPTVRQRSGSDAAEEALRRAAHQIKGSLRSVDIVARLRDREFALLLPETGPDAAGAVLERIARVLSVSVEEERCPVSFAIGAVTWLHADLSVPSLHQRTYQLMYAARQGGERVRHEVLGERRAAGAP